MKGLRTPKWRTLAAVLAAGLIAAACSDDGGDPGTDETPTDGGTATGDAGDGGNGEAFTYQTGIFEEPTTDNYWAYIDPDSSVWNQYILAGTSCGLYGVQMPDVVYEADVAAEEEPPTPEDNVVTVTLKDGLTWSDGEPLTAEDVAFTANTVRELQLGGSWLSLYPYPSEEGGDATVIESVEAQDETTVVFTFNQRPGLGVWPSNVGTAPILPKHFWESTVEEAKGSEDPATTLYEASGAGSPSCGPVVFEEIEAGAFARVSANDSYHNLGETESFEAAGGGEYEEGPHFDEEVFSLYGGQDPAVLALQQGEVDYLYNPLGMQRGLREKVVGDENLEAVSNASYGLRYLAFNFRTPPLDDKAFRQALATMIDRDFMAENVLQGVAFPLFTAMPESNPGWYNEEVAEQLKEPYVGYEDQESRLERAVEILEEAGYTWQTKPTVEVDDEGVKTVTNGEGLTMPDGTAVPDLELLAPGPGYDPLRSTYSVWIQQWAEQLGIPLEAKPTNFNVIVEQVFVNDPPTFDLYILGWSLGNPVFPTYYEDFFATDGGSNVMAFSNEEYDQAVQQFLNAESNEEAYNIVWDQLEPIIADELPYVMLFDTPILEFYRAASVSYPFTETLGGIQFSTGLKTAVNSAQ